MIHIQMNEAYTQTTWHTGIFDDKYHFCVGVDYCSIAQKYEVSGIKWNEDWYIYDDEEKISEERKMEAEKRIKDFVLKWLFGEKKDQDDKCCKGCGELSPICYCDNEELEDE